MVFSKRKRKDNSQVSAIQITEEPKRTKIQAQRKFAQGQHAPTSTYLTYNSGQSTPVKENSNPPVDFLPNVKPSTEDFLSYICFKGTNMLPKNLDFSNMSRGGGTSAMNSNSTQPTTSKNASSNLNNSNSTSSAASKSKANKEEPKTNEKEFMPFAVRKRAEQQPEKADRKKLLANKKNLKNNETGSEKSNEANLNSKKRQRGRNAGESNQNLEALLPNKNQKLDSSLSKISDVKIILEKTDMEKEIEKNKRKASPSVAGKKSDNIKRTTRLAALKNNYNSPVKEVEEKEEVVEKVQDKDFSSDDDEPLVKISEQPTKTISNSSHSNKKLKLNDESPEKKEVNDFNKTNDTDSSTPQKQVKKRGRPALNKNLKQNNKTPPASSSIPVLSLNSTPPPTQIPPKVEPTVEEIPVQKKKVGRKKKVTADAEIAELSQNTTDLSENEANRGGNRPQRKSKAAAELYLHLIGRKLTVNDFSDDDASSLDSLELPNFKKIEQMENELKANFNKNVEEKRKNEEKKSNFMAELKNTKEKEKLKEKEKEKLKENEKEKLKDKPEENNKTSPNKEKSFNESDEEPLVTKVVVENKKPPPKKRGRKSAIEKQKMLEEAMLKSENVEVPITKPTEKITPEKMPFLSPSSKIQSPQNLNQPQTPNNETLNVSTKTTENQFSTKLNQSNDNNKFSPTVAEPASTSFQKPFKSNQDANFNKLLDDDAFVKNFDSNTVKPISLVSKPAINLLPSKEESEKIFGIASVSLAQSSGPLDTKCTLGKCGSVHKPPLGPAVLTESALGVNLSPKDRRKTKVNMTREQIQKWLDQTSWTPIPDELDEADTPPAPTPTAETKPSNKTPPVQSTFVPVKNEDSKEFTRSSDIVSTPTTSKGPTLKAKPVAIIPDIQEKSSEALSAFPKFDFKSESQEPEPAPTPKKIEEPKKTVTVEPKKQPIYQTERKPIYQKQPKKTPVYKTIQEPKPSNKKQQFPLTNPFGAFSPENEHSVYSFDREEDDIPAATPFRRCSRQESVNSKAEDVAAKKEFQKPHNYVSGNSTPSKQIPQVSLTLSPEDNKKSASIAVNQTDGEVTPGSKGKTETVEKTQENDSDSEGHTFYIPLQTTSVAGNKNDQLIQGVAVKLGTEGAEGPNQRIIMHAKLVTKSRIGTSTSVLPDSMTNVQELVKSLMANNKEEISTTSKPVPCATVQPRFKSSDSQENLSQQNESLPSTSKSIKPAAKVNKVVKYDCDIQPTNNSVFPNQNDPANMVDAPIFRPTEKEFQDPLEYIEKITPIASRFGICRIIPPDSFKPDCRVSDEMRFTASNQYVHKMLHRWGPSAKEFAAIKKYLATQSIVFQHPPLIAGMEVDLPRLYHTVQELGGLKEVIEKKKWSKVAEDMCIPKQAHDRATKLDDIYCKYLLPYDTLSPNERQKLFDEVEADWAKRETKARRNADKGVESDEQSNEEDDDESEEDDNNSMECMVKGRSMSLSQFFRVARNTMALLFKNTAEPTTNEIEVEYWHHVAVRSSHVCVHYGSIDSSGFGYGFPMPGPKTKSSICSKHPWNLKVLTNNSQSILRSLGPVMGVTVPTLHVGMLFSAVCWYRDPHGLPWIEYLHTGSSKIWYAVPDEQSSNFRSAMTSLVPSLVQNKTIWLPCDSAMVPPYMLTDRNVSLCRTEQQPGQFVVVFPRAYTSSLCTGYTISESVYFASPSWLDSAVEDFKDIQESCEPSMFSLEQLLFALANDQRTATDTIQQILPLLSGVYDTEKSNRQLLKDAGVTNTEKKIEPKNKLQVEELECNYCRANLHISWIKLCDEDDESNYYCLKHALKYLNEDRIQANQCKLLYTYTIDDIKNLLMKLHNKVSSLIQQSGGDQNQSLSADSQNKKKGNQKVKQNNKSGTSK